MNIIFLLHPKETVAYLNENATVRQGLEKMRVHGYTAIPVIGKDGSYVGTITEGDFLWHMVFTGKNDIKDLEEHHISDIMRPDFNPAVRISATIDDLLLRVMNQNFIPVVDDRNLFMGIITRKDVIKYFYDKDREK